jgi:hypothetical protein
VYDRRPEPRNDTSDTGRSYTITIIERGMAALQQLGITLPAHSGSKALGTVRHDVSGAVTISPQTGALTFSRAELTQLLINEAKRRYPSAINFVWGTTCTSVELKAQVAHFAGEAGGDEVKAYDLLVGADGVGSQVGGGAVRLGRGHGCGCSAALYLLVVSTIVGHACMCGKSGAVQHSPHCQHTSCAKPFTLLTPLPLPPGAPRPGRWPARLPVPGERLWPRVQGLQRPGWRP